MPELLDLPLVVATRTQADDTVYIDQATGDDITGDGSQGLPYETLTPVIEDHLKATVIDHTIRVICGPGTYEWVPVPAKVLNNFITFEWDEALVTKNVLVASQAAGAGTTDSLIDFVGNLTDFGGKYVEWLDGAAVGHRNTIRDNFDDIEHLIPDRHFAAVPAPGDNFELFESLVTFTPPDPDGADTFKAFNWFGGDLRAIPEASHQLPVIGGIGFIGINIDRSPTYSFHNFGAAFYFMYGLEMLTANDRHFFEGDAAIYAGTDPTNSALEDLIPALTSTKWQGWGLTNKDLNGPFLQDPSGFFQGFERNAGRVNHGEGVATILGGHATQLSTPSKMTVFSSPFFSKNKFLARSTTNTPAVDMAVGGAQGFMRLLDVDVRKAAGANPLVDVGEASVLEYNAATVGDNGGTNPTVRARSGARVFATFGAPALGDAAGNDYDHGGTAFNKSALAVVDDEQFHNGTLIVRAS